jgi:PHP family Zn ribbon phosphoesterase
MGWVTGRELDLNLQAVLLYRMGYSLRQISFHQDRGYKAVEAALRRLGVPRRAVGAYRHATVAGLPSLFGPLGPAAGETCERCGLLLQGSQNANRQVLCDECDAELRRGVLYRDGELDPARRRVLGYG